MAPHEIDRGFATMADHSAHGGSSTSNFAAHKATYDAFIKGSVALTILCIYTLVALVAFRVAAGWGVILGFAGMIEGVIADESLGAGAGLNGDLEALFGIGLHRIGRGGDAALARLALGRNGDFHERMGISRHSWR